MKKTVFIGTLLSVFATIFSSAIVDAKDAHLTAVRPEVVSIRFTKDVIVFDLNNNDLMTDSFEVIGDSNVDNGFSISISAVNGNNSLKNVDPLINAYIPSIVGNVTEGTFPEDGWGYSLDSSNYIFHEVPLTSMNVFHKDEFGTGTYGMSIGLKSGQNLPYGRYVGGIMFTIVPNV